jgi:FtsP/CotA-like multicopper oxidase with cupredoxin domain
MDHSGHAMGMEMEGGWRMPPMNMEMPMLPGLEGVVPVVQPMLPGQMIDPASLPEAVPSQVVAMADGDVLDISVSMVRRTLAGQTLAMFGYNGQYPGPLIQAPKDATLTIRVTNDIQMPTTVHWHGIRLDNAYDGVPGVTQDPIGPGESFEYQVKVPDAGMFWYHPHVREDVQQDLGLFGNLLVTSPDPDYYGPMHREEILVLDDILMDSNGLIPYGQESPTHALMGRFGNVLMVNGGTDRSLEVRRGEVVRFYLTNVANTRTFNVQIAGAQMKVVASDVSRYEREQWVESVVIAPAERYIVDVRFPESGSAAMVNAIQAMDHMLGIFEPQTDTLMRITVADEAAEPDLRAAFETLRTHPEVEDEVAQYRSWVDREPDHSLETTVRIQDLPLPIVQMMEMDTLYVPPMEWNDGMPMMNWLSTGEQVEWILRDTDTGAENGAIDWRFEVGDVVKIRVHNTARSFHPMQHPFHIHGQRFVVVAVDGVANPNMVWKDTAIIPVGSTVDLVVEMSNPGEWMAHCHIAEHLHTGMMFGFTVDPVGTADPEMGPG